MEEQAEGPHKQMHLQRMKTFDKICVAYRLNAPYIDRLNEMEQLEKTRALPFTIQGDHGVVHGHA